MRITNDQTTFGAYFTNNSNFRDALRNSEARKYSFELMERFRKLPDHEVEIIKLQQSPNLLYSTACEVYNRTTGMYKSFIIHSHQQLETLMSRLLDTIDGHEFFDEKTNLAILTKGLTTPQTINEKLEM